MQNDQEMPNELNTVFKDTVSNLEINENPYIINQVSNDILDLVEKCINKYNFIQAYYLSKIGLRFNISFHSML